MPSREAWGIDIGQTAIHAVKLKRGKGDIAEIVDIFFHKMDTHLDDPDYESKVLEALKLLVSSKKVGSTPVVVSLPGFTTLFRDFALPPVGASRLDEIVSYEAKQLIPYPLEEVIWDYHQLREDEETGELGIALVCCRRDIIEGTLSLLDEAKLNVDGLQVGPIALVNYSTYDSPPEGTTLLLDTGARGTDFIVVNDGSFWLRSIGVSGTDITKALMSRFTIPYERAEALKFEMGDSKQGDRVFRVVEPVLRNLCGEVQRSVGYYKSLFRGVQIQEVVCAGNTYLLAGVDQFVADNVGIATRTLGMPASLKILRTLEPEVDANHQVLGTAAGLALQGVGLAEIDTTLLPPERRLSKEIAAKVKWGIAAVAAMALMVVSGILFPGISAEKYKDQQKAAKQVMKQAAGIRRVFEDKQKLYEPTQKKSETLARVSKGARGWFIDTLAAVYKPVDEINDKRAPMVEQLRKDLLEELNDEFRNDLKEYPEKWDDLKVWLEGVIEYRAEWVSSRIKLIVPQKMNAKTVMVVKAPGSTDDKPRWQLATAKDTKDTRSAVQVTMNGYIVTGGDKSDTTGAKAVQYFINRFKEIPGVMPGTFKYRRELRKKGSVIAPKVVAPPIPAEGDTKPDKPTIESESIEEERGLWEVSFVYSVS